MNYTIEIKDAGTIGDRLNLSITDNETGRARGDLRPPEQLLEWLMARGSEIEALRKIETGWCKAVPVPPLTPDPNCVHAVVAVKKSGARKCHQCKMELPPESPDPPLEAVDLVDASSEP